MAGQAGWLLGWVMELAANQSSIRKHRSASLRRSRVTTITCSAPGDRVTAQWNPDKREWQLFTESSNGLRIENKRLDAA
jgi:hypothetical protein